MDPCTVETGLLRKKPCGHAAVAQCANCERPLCAQHAVAQLAESGKKSGKFLCKECAAAWREQEKNVAAIAKSAPPTARKPVEPAKPAAPKEAPAESKPAAKDGGGIDFTPTKK